MQGYDYMLYEKHLSIYVANSLVNIRSYSSTYMTYFLGWQIISETYAIGDGILHSTIWYQKIRYNICLNSMNMLCNIIQK